jgi:hypothetical protein
MADFISEPAFEIGRRAEIRGAFAWFVVVKPPIEADAALENSAADMSAVLGQPLRIVHATASVLEKVRADLKDPADDPVLIPDLDQADAEYWRALDINRSGLLREGPVVLWLSTAGLTRLCERAPNLRSFIGGSIFYLGIYGDAMLPSERQQRISDLESHFQMTSAEVVARAESRTLPTEPHFVEWLVLLDRGIWFECRMAHRIEREPWVLD